MEDVILVDDISGRHLLWNGEEVARMDMEIFMHKDYAESIAPFMPFCLSPNVPFELGRKARTVDGLVYIEMLKLKRFLMLENIKEV